MQLPTDLPAGTARTVVTSDSDLAVPLIDDRIMRDWCDDMDHEDVVAILARVPHEGAKSLADLYKSIKDGDLALARRSAHRLKGMANNLGAARLARVARAIELESPGIEEVSRRMPTLEQTLGETLEALRSRC